MDDFKISEGKAEPITLSSLERSDVQAKAKSILVELMRNTMQLTKKDIDKWRKAWQMAINKDNPKRYQLYQIYIDNLVDLHLLGAIRQRKLKVLAKPVKVIDRKTKEIDEELTELLQARWFKQVFKSCHGLPVLGPLTHTV